VRRRNHGFRYGSTRIYGIGLHGHLGSCGSIDEDGDLSTVPQGRRLTRASEDNRVCSHLSIDVTGRIDTGRAVRNRENQLDETRLDKEQIVNLSITYCKTIVN
jgi:hypothetical protein